MDFISALWVLERVRLVFTVFCSHEYILAFEYHCMFFCCALSCSDWSPKSAGFTELSPQLCSWRAGVQQFGSSPTQKHPLNLTVQKWIRCVCAGKSANYTERLPSLGPNLCICDQFIVVENSEFCFSSRNSPYDSTQRGSSGYDSLDVRHFEYMTLP